jgi:hypothetical protein
MKTLYPWPPPAGSQAFDFASAIALPVVTTSGVVLSFQVPAGFRGIIRRLSHNHEGSGFVNGSGSLVWRLLVNQSVVKNYGALVTEFGSVQLPRETDGIPLQQNDRVRYEVVNVSLGVAGTTVICSAAGFFWPM